VKNKLSRFLWFTVYKLTSAVIGGLSRATRYAL